VVLPRTRLNEAMDKGWINVRPYTNPLWMTAPEKLVWSPVVFETADRFMTAGGYAPITTLDQLAGNTIGTILGYTYPSLQEQIDAGKLVRADVASFDQNVLKLQGNRIKIMVGSELILYATAKELGSAVMVHPLAIDKVAIRWALSPELAKSHSELLKAIQDLVDAGGVTRILARYR
jgi:polar amino acid transport system substrate-binding protein